MEQEHQLKSLLTEQQFEDAENKEFMLAQARACANGYALATEGIAVVSDFQNNECHIYSGRFGQTIMDFPEYMVDHTSAFENTVFSHANEEELIQRHILELRFFNFIKELPINEKTNFSASCIISFYRTGSNETIKISLNPQLHSRSATYKRNGLLIRKTAIKSSRPFQCAYYPLTP